jgi:hypothetical protein
MDREARKEDARFMAKVLVLFILLFALLHIAPAIAASYVAKDAAGNVVRLLDEPCDVTTGWLKARKAYFRYEGKEYKSCWISLKDLVLILDETGDVTPLPVQAFRKEEGA